MLAERLAEVEDRIQRAIARAGRTRKSIQLIAVTKTFPADVVRDAYAAGLRHFGENYVQEFETKRPLIGELPGAHFHLIGHLQSNKSRKAAELFQTIQTIDDEKLAKRLEDTARPLSVMIEVKLSTEDSKHGAAPEAVSALVDRIRACPHLELGGLMTIPPWSEDPETSRPYFAQLRELGERLGVPGLSMGMSNDFEAAIEEGATHVRVGTALFGRRVRPA